MNKVNKHAHTHTSLKKSKSLKKENSGSRSPFSSSTFLRECSMTSALYMIFKTVMKKRINSPQVNARCTYILLD